jgi:hypothetical protein
LSAVALAPSGDCKKRRSVPAIATIIATIIAAIVSSVVTVLDNHSGADNRRRSRNRPAHHATSARSSRSQRHLRLLP